MSITLNKPVRVRVNRILPYGLLVSLDDGQIGVIRKRELWDAAASSDNAWREQFKPGDSLQAVVLKRTPDRRLELSLRLAQDDPWDNLPERYHVDQLVKGIVTGLQSYGAFIELEPGVTGLLHRSQLPAWTTEDVMDTFWPSDHVWVTIQHIDFKHRRLSLSLNRTLLQRWESSGGSQSSRTKVSKASSRQGSTDTNKPERTPLELVGQIKPQSILVVEDEFDQCQAMANWLQRAGHHVLTASSAEESLTLLETQRPDWVLMDLMLPGMNGLQALQQIRIAWPEVRAAIITGWANADEHLAELEALCDQGVHLLIKPLLPDDLINLLLDRQGDQISPRLHEKTAIQASLPSLPTESVNYILFRLRRLTGASKVVLFVFDQAQRKVNIVAENGDARLNEEALIDLVHSPVRDVAEDEMTIRIQDARNVEALARYLNPLLSYQCCLGVPVPGDLAQKYALFLFHSRPGAFNEAHEELARVGAIALGAWLEHQQFRLRAADMQRLVLLGHLTRAMVHEINQPLNRIGFDLESLEEQCARIENLALDMPGAIIAEVRQAQGTLRGLAYSVHNLVRTAQLFGQMTVQSQEQILRLDEMVEEVANLLHDNADRAHVAIVIQPPPRLYFTRVQAAQVQQILLNIILNAIQQIAALRPQAGGQIQIRLGQQQSSSSTTLQICVEDDGPGIHRRLWRRIFELGYTRREGGSGLGLYISNGLAEAMGGRIYVAESYILWGTTFVIELPFRR